MPSSWLISDCQKESKHHPVFNQNYLEWFHMFDPKSFIRRRSTYNNNQTTQIYSLNEKSDIYSIGVLFWEISSGKPPFYSEGKQYDVGLALDISQGLRETIVPDTPEDYVKIYTSK